MNTLPAVAQQYQRHADRVVRLHTDDNGTFDAKYQDVVDFYRNAAASVSRLIDEPKEGSSELKILGDEKAKVVGFTSK